MSRIQETFEQLMARHEKALVAFVTAGDPDPARSLEVIEALCDAGVDILELGVPFSDPTADGPVIQRSSGRALAAGMTLARVFQMTATIRRFSQVPIVLFSYYNPILAYGLDRFYREAVASGADGVLVVDLPPEESDEMTSRWEGNALDVIRLVAPTTPMERMKRIAAEASGFLYLVSMTGVTGSGGLDLHEVSEVAGRLRSVSPLPICVGFGISTPEQTARVAGMADGVVVGSAFERVIEDNLDDPNLAGRVGTFAGALKEATRLGG
jgi:tryptophan synthase alpha chain